MTYHALLYDVNFETPDGYKILADCGHKHRTKKAALRCEENYKIQRDRRGVNSGIFKHSKCSGASWGTMFPFSRGVE